MITVRALHDGIFAVSSDLDTWPDDCFPPPQPSCKSCLHWISGKAFCCAVCEQTYCNPACASSERHRCAGRQTAVDKLPCPDPHQRRLKRQTAYCERQRALQSAVESLDRVRT